MPNIGSLLKDEISRLSRKEARRQAAPLRKISTQQRRLIAALRKQVSALESRVKALSAEGGKTRSAEVVTDSGAKAPRFVAKGLRTLRTRLGLSAADLGRMVGVTGQSIYNWEAGKAKPRRAQVVALAALRGAGKKQVQAQLAGSADAPAAKKAPARAARAGRKPGRKPGTKPGRKSGKKPGRKPARKAAGKRRA